jgi:hypothetical protein
MIDRAIAGITDPAELFTRGMRISGRPGWTHPDIAGFLTGAGPGALDIPNCAAPPGEPGDSGRYNGSCAAPHSQAGRAAPG